MRWSVQAERGRLWVNAVASLPDQEGLIDTKVLLSFAEGAYHEWITKISAVLKVVGVRPNNRSESMMPTNDLRFEGVAQDFGSNPGGGTLIVLRIGSMMARNTVSPSRRLSRVNPMRGRDTAL